MRLYRRRTRSFRRRGRGVITGAQASTAAGSAYLEEDATQLLEEDGGRYLEEG